MKEFVSGDNIIYHVHLKIYGKIQGVNFRWFVQETGKSLGLKGYVKNLPDGTVEIICESETEKPYRDFIRKIENKRFESPGLYKEIDVEKIVVLEFEKRDDFSFDYFNISY